VIIFRPAIFFPKSPNFLAPIRDFMIFFHLQGTFIEFFVLIVGQFKLFSKLPLFLTPWKLLQTKVVLPKVAELPPCFFPMVDHAGQFPSSLLPFLPRASHRQWRCGVSDTFLV